MPVAGVADADWVCHRAALQERYLLVPVADDPAAADSAAPCSTQSRVTLPCISPCRGRSACLRPVQHTGLAPPGGGRPPFRLAFLLLHCGNARRGLLRLPPAYVSAQRRRTSGEQGGQPLGRSCVLRPLPLVSRQRLSWLPPRRRPFDSHGRGLDRLLLSVHVATCPFQP